MDAAVSHLLRTCLSRSPKDQAISLSTSQLSMPKDTSRLKKHIMLLCDRIGKGGRLSVSSEANAPTPVMMPGQNHECICMWKKKKNLLKSRAIKSFAIHFHLSLTARMSCFKI